MDPRLYDKGYTEDQIKQMRMHMGSSGSIEGAGLQFSRDLKEFVHPKFNYLMTLFTMYDEHGTLPFSGGTAEQPAQIIEIFDIFKILKMQQEEIAMKEAERKSKRK